MTYSKLPGTSSSDVAFVIDSCCRLAFFHAVQYQLVYLKNLIECTLKKISKINDFFLNYEGTFWKYLIDTFQ